MRLTNGPLPLLSLCFNLLSLLPGNGSSIIPTPVLAQDAGEGGARPEIVIGERLVLERASLSCSNGSWTARAGWHREAFVESQ